MKLNIEPLKKWFGFSRRERRSTFILLIIICIIIILRYSVPANNIDIEYISTGNSVLESITEINAPAASQSFKHEKNMKQTERIIPFAKVKNDSSVKFRDNYSLKRRPLVDLNNCDSASLDRLPGIGPVLSIRILKYRQLLGGFAIVDQLKEVYGLPVETFDLIKSRVFVDSSSVIKIKINSADSKKLSRLPYIENYEVKAILKYRELKGNITGITDLVDNKLITEEKARKILPYLNFE